jgi:hypothetical protein
MLIRSFFEPKTLDSLKRGFEIAPEETSVMLRDHVMRVVAEILKKEGSSAALKAGDQLRKEVDQLELLYARSAQTTVTRSMASPSRPSWRQSADFARLNSMARSHVLLVAKHHSPGHIPSLIRSLLSQGHGARR